MEDNKRKVNYPKKKKPYLFSDSFSTISSLSFIPEPEVDVDFLDKIKKTLKESKNKPE